MNLTNRLSIYANNNPLQFTIRLLLLGFTLMISSCIVGKEINIGYTNRDLIPVLWDTNSADSIFVEEQIIVADSIVSNEFEDYLYNMRQQDFYYPKQGGGTYVIRYHDSDIIYAAIVSSSNVTQEDIVFYKKKWYYNHNGKTEEIGKKQAMAFVDTILKSVASQQTKEEGSAVLDGS